MKKCLNLLLLILTQNLFSQSSEFIKNSETNIIIKDTIYDAKVVDKMPDFPNGMVKFYEYLGKNFNITKSKENVSGKILMTFVIEIDGSISTINIINDFEGMGKEAIRVMKICPNWISGENNGEIVRTRFQFPIRID